MDFSEFSDRNIRLYNGREWNDRYKLDKIEAKVYVKKIISFDVETHNNNREFTLASTYDGKEYKMFFGEKGREELKHFLVDIRHQNTFICATNLQFDFCAMEDMKNFWRYKILSRGSKYIGIKKITKYENMKHKGHDTVFSNTFVDTMNHFAQNVESAGKVLGIHKMDKPATLGKNPRKNVTATAVNDKGEIYEIDGMNELEYLIEYNKRDTLVSYMIMEKMQEIYNKLGCEMKMTISSTALDLWRRKYFPQILFREDFVLNTDVKHKIFECFYGGRTEIFGRGIIKSGMNEKTGKYEQWCLYDANALYPSVMRNEFPLPQSIHKPEKYTISNIKEYHGFSDVSIECDYMYYPLLPYRDEDIGKNIFPIGKWRGRYTHLELRKALELGYRILEIHEQYIYTKNFYPFKEYVEELYKIRLQYQKEKNPLEVFIKLLSNSLFGKTGQKSFIEQEWFDTEEMSQKEFEAYLNSTDTYALGTVGYRNIEKESDRNFIYPILPAYVTAYGRLLLYDYMVKYNAVYTDTDSLITNKYIEHSTELGKMKLEAKLKKAILIRPKMYLKQDEFDKTFIKVKGLPRASIESFENIIQGQTVHYNKFTRPSESIRRGYPVNSVRDEHKEMDINDNKRIWKYPFSDKTFSTESEPIMIDALQGKKTKKIIIKRTVREKMNSKKSIK